MMRKAIATVSLSGTLEEKLAAAAAAGFDAVELFEPDLIACPLRPAEIRRLAGELGLGIDLYQPFRDFEAVTPERLAHNLRRAEAKLDVMEALGADTILVCSNVAGDPIDDDALAAEQLHALAERAAQRGMRIAYEALAWGRHVNTYDHAWRIVEAAGHPALGTCLDSFHILSRGSDPAGIRAIPGEKVFFLQLADAPRLAMDVLQWSRHYRCFPGQGGFDLAALLRHVLATGYDGPLSLEIFNDVLRQADPVRTAVDAMRSLLVLEDSVAPHLAAAPALDGYAFVELAAGGEAEAVLRALGFARTGRHRSKPVDLWEQGEARIVINRGGPAGDPRVVALAVASGDPDRSTERAEALLAPVLARRHGPEEADLAAVAAPDGTSVFFCGPEWRGDFVAREPGGAGLLTRIDHVALTHPFDTFDEAALFYRALLGLRPQESQDVASPGGLVRSRAVSDAAGGVRLVLNVPVLASGGPQMLQHVAFACDDALAAARALRARGAPLLAVPANYYDDLAARTALDPELVAAMRELGVLYDRDERGELLHVFTAMVGRGLFFELVERRGAYDGYGHANSPVRMGAHRAPAAVSPAGARLSAA